MNLELSIGFHLPFLPKLFVKELALLLSELHNKAFSSGVYSWFVCFTSGNIELDCSVRLIGSPINCSSLALALTLLQELPIGWMTLPSTFPS